MHIGNGREKLGWIAERYRGKSKERERERERGGEEGWQKCAGSCVVCYGYPFAADGN